MVASTSSRSSGLRRNASAEIACARDVASADMATTGMGAIWESLRWAFLKLQPSMTGMRRSRRMRSGARSSVRRLRASRPSEALETS